MPFCQVSHNKRIRFLHVGRNDIACVKLALIGDMKFSSMLFIRADMSKRSCLISVNFSICLPFLFDCFVIVKVEAIQICLTYLGDEDAGINSQTAQHPKLKLLVKCANLVINAVHTDGFPY